MTSIRLCGLALTALITTVALTGCAAERPSVPRLEKVALATDANLQRIAKLSTLSDELVTALVPADKPGCSAAVGVRGDVVWAAAAGLADLTSREPLTTSTRFDMASISKQFTATALLNVQREGVLSLDDAVAVHVDGLPRWANDITLEQLMHHTARVPEFWVELEKTGIGFTDPADHDTVLAAIAREEELVEGEGYAYSNSHYVLLAEVIEAVKGQPFALHLDELISRALDLDLTVAPGAVEPDIATPYDADLSVLRGGWTAYGHSGIVTTPSDLVRWGDQYRLGELVPDDAVDEVVTVRDEDGQENGELYGAGIRLEPDGSLYHSGRWGGFISDLTITPDRQTVIAVACNGRAAPRFEVADAVRQVWAPIPVDAQSTAD